MRVLLAGCGRLGLRVAELLLQGGAEVWGLRRRWPENDSPDQLQRLSVDLHDRAALAAALPDGIEVIIHTLTPGSRDQAGYRQAYVATLAALLALPQLSAPTQRWLFVSSTAVYGDAQGGELDEEAPTKPAGFNGRVLLEAEHLLLSSRANSLCLRLGGIYGPGREFLLRQLQAGRHRVQRTAPHYGNRIHAEDAAQMLAWLAGRNETGVINGVDGNPVDEATLADWLSERLGAAPAADRPEDDQPRPNRRILPRRLRQAGYLWRYPDWRIGYSELIDAATDAS